MTAPIYLANEFILIRISDRGADVYTRITGELTSCHYQTGREECDKNYWIKKFDMASVSEVSEKLAEALLGGVRPWEENK